MILLVFGNAGVHNSVLEARNVPTKGEYINIEDRIPCQLSSLFVGFGDSLGVEPLVDMFKGIGIFVG